MLLRTACRLAQRRPPAAPRRPRPRRARRQSRRSARATRPPRARPPPRPPPPPPGAGRPPVPQPPAAQTCDPSCLAEHLSVCSRSSRFGDAIAAPQLPAGTSRRRACDSYPSGRCTATLTSCAGLIARGPWVPLAQPAVPVAGGRAPARRPLLRARPRRRAYRARGAAAPRPQRPPQLRPTARPHPGRPAQRARVTGLRARWAGHGERARRPRASGCGSAWTAAAAPLH